jgi:phosphatidylglycerophosphatase A
MNAYPIEQLLNKRGITVERIADIVYALAYPFNDRLQLRHCIESVYAVLDKPEVQQTLYTGIALDEMAERNLLPQPLQTMLEADEPLGSVDETLALGLVRLFGARSITGFERLTKETSSHSRLLAWNGSGSIHVFLDDLVTGLAAAAAARLTCEQPEAPNNGANCT